MSTASNVTLSLPVDEAILLCALAHRWEVERRLNFENVAEYFALHNLSGRLSSQEPVARALWLQDDIPLDQVIPRAAEAAAARVTSELRKQDWPAEWFEQYPPRAFTIIGDEYTAKLAPNAGLNDLALLLARLVQHQSEALTAASSGNSLSLQKGLVRAVSQHLGFTVRIDGEQ